MSPTFDPAASSNPTPAMLLAPIIAAVLPGWAFVVGTLKQLNQALDELPAGGRAVCLNDLINVTIKTAKNGRSTLTFAPTMLFCIKSNEDDSGLVRDGYTREALAATRAVLYKIQVGENGLTVLGDAQGATFLDLFDAEVDGAEFGLVLEAGPDAFDYCTVTNATAPTV